MTTTWEEEWAATAALDRATRAILVKHPSATLSIAYSLAHMTNPHLYERASAEREQAGFEGRRLTLPERFLAHHEEACSCWDYPPPPVELHLLAEDGMSGSEILRRPSRSYAEALDTVRIKHPDTWRAVIDEFADLFGSEPEGGAA